MNQELKHAERERESPGYIPSSLIYSMTRGEVRIGQGGREREMGKEDVRQKVWRGKEAKRMGKESEREEGIES